MFSRFGTQYWRVMTDEQTRKHVTTWPRYDW